MTKEKDTLKKIDKALSKKSPVNLYSILAIILFSVLVSSTIFYYVGHSEGYGQKTNELIKVEKLEVQQNLMQLEVGEVWDIFLKNLMIKTMFWLPMIIAGLIVVLLLHGFKIIG